MDKFYSNLKKLNSNFFKLIFLKPTYSILFLLMLSFNVSLGQQVQSIQAEVTFHFLQTSPESTNNLSNIETLTTNYNLFVMPSFCLSTQLGSNGHSKQYIMDNSSNILNAIPLIEIQLF